MANDDFTAHNDELTPEDSEHAHEEGSGNPFYTEVSPTELVIEDDIVFDEPLSDDAPFVGDAQEADTDAAPSEHLVDDAPADEAPHDYTVTDFGGAGTSVSLEADDLPQEDHALEDSVQGDEVEGSPAAEDSIGPEMGEEPAADANGVEDESPHDYTVTDFGGAGTSVVLEADALSPDDEGGEDVAPDFADEEPPVELVVEEALTSEGEATAEDASFVSDYDPETDPELTRPAILPTVGAPNVLASNAHFTPLEDEEAEHAVEVPSAELDAETAPVTDIMPEPELTAEPEPTAVPTLAPELELLPEGGLFPEAEPMTDDDVAAQDPAMAVPVVEEPAPVPATEPPAVASAIPVTAPTRGDDSTWQEISRRRSLFPPVSEASIETPEERVVLDEVDAEDLSVEVPESMGMGEESTELLAAAPATEEDEGDIHTTTIPVASADEVANYQPGPHSGEIPLDVLSGREKEVDELTTTMMRRDLLAAPPSAETESATSWRQALHESAAPLPAGDTPQKLDDAIFEGTTVIPVVPSRVGTHLFSLVLTILLAPLTWYFLADAGARMTLAEGAPIATGQISVWALLEFGIGIIGFIALVALALRSSLGAWVSGLLVTLAGLPWIFAPAAMMNLTQPGFDWISSLGVVGRNLSHHLQVSAYSGRLLLLGIALWAIGIVSHSVRRRGRAEEALRAEVERVNPTGAHLTWSARRRAAKEAARNERI